MFPLKLTAAEKPSGPKAALLVAWFQLIPSLEDQTSLR
jgi:hypothetical protein